MKKKNYLLVGIALSFVCMFAWIIGSVSIDGKVNVIDSLAMLVCSYILIAVVQALLLIYKVVKLN